MSQEAQTSMVPMAHITHLLVVMLLELLPISAQVNIFKNACSNWSVSTQNFRVRVNEIVTLARNFRLEIDSHKIF